MNVDMKIKDIVEKNVDIKKDIVEKNIVEVPRLKTNAADLVKITSWKCRGHSSSSSSPSGARCLARPEEATVCQEQSPGNTAGKDYR